MLPFQSQLPMVMGVYSLTRKALLYMLIVTDSTKLSIRKGKTEDLTGVKLKILLMRRKRKNLNLRKRRKKSLNLRELAAWVLLTLKICMKRNRKLASSALMT